MTSEPKLIVSKKSQSISSAGETVYVEIYRLETDKRWALSIDDEFGNTTVWEADFKSEKGALLEAKKAILKEGIGVFVGLENKNS